MHHKDSSMEAYNLSNGFKIWDYMNKKNNSYLRNEGDIYQFLLSGLLGCN